jgi:hypothetical protein
MDNLHNCPKYSLFTVIEHLSKKKRAGQPWNAYSRAARLGVGRICKETKDWTLGDIYALPPKEFILILMLEKVFDT